VNPRGWPAAADAQQPTAKYLYYRRHLATITIQAPQSVRRPDLCYNLTNEAEEKSRAGSSRPAHMYNR
jgi:hypothetical protein